MRYSFFQISYSSTNFQLSGRTRSCWLMVYLPISLISSRISDLFDASALPSSPPTSSNDSFYYDCLRGQRRALVAVLLSHFFEFCLQRYSAKSSSFNRASILFLMRLATSLIFWILGIAFSPVCFPMYSGTSFSMVSCSLRQSLANSSYCLSPLSLLSALSLLSSSLPLFLALCSESLLLRIRYLEAFSSMRQSMRWSCSKRCLAHSLRGRVVLLILLIILRSTNNRYKCSLINNHQFTNPHFTWLILE